MALFDDVFNRGAIYDTLFFSVKAVLQYPNLEELEKNNKPLFERWKYLSETKYNSPFKLKIIPPEGHNEALQEVYEKNAPYYPEFSRIVVISYAKLFIENGAIKRTLKKIANDNEEVVIATFMDELHHVSSDATKSSPPFFPILCGYNIISYDIPLLMKRFIANKSKLENKQLPFILKRAMNIKPWESGLMDAINVWKFNGYDMMPLMLIADFMGLKKTTDLLPLPEFSKYYWENVKTEPEKTWEYIGLQSVTHTNLVIQLMNELRQL
jgi:hypothetical protein